MIPTVALANEVSVCLQRVVECGGEGVFRSEPVGGTEHAHALFICKRCGEALGVVEIAAGIASPVQVKYDSLTALVPRYDPCALEAVEGMITHLNVLFMYGFHKLAKLVLSPAYGFQ